MNKPKFDPNKPFEVVEEAPVVGQKPKFDPNKPFEVVEGEPQEQPGLLRQGLDYAGRGLDYVGGLTRTGLAASADLARSGFRGMAGEPQEATVVTPDDVMLALKGKAPSSSEYLERFGYGKGPTATLPFLGEVSGRGAVGLGLDIATDPLTAITKGIKGAGKIGRAANIAGEATEAAGEGIYKSGFKKVDERLAEKGKGSLGELLIAEGAPTGSTKAVKTQAVKIAKDALTERNDLFKKATEAGASVDLGFPLKNTDEALAEIRRTSPRLEEKLGEIEAEMVDPFRKKGKVDLQTLSDYKTRLYKSLPDAAFGPNGKPKGVYAELDRALAQDFRQAIIDSGNKAEAGLGDRIDSLNEKLGTILSADKPLAMQIRREVTPNLVTSVDAIMLGLGHGGAIPVKKLADVAKTTRFRTNLGKGLMKAGRTPIPDAMLRRGLGGLLRDDE